MDQPGISKQDVGRIAERIVANELEYRGFRVSDLNKEGISANADLLAVKDGKTWQIQVKGASEPIGSRWVSYGFCTEEHIANKEKPMFNQASGFYQASHIVLASVQSPTKYRCVVLPLNMAEKAAQLNLDYAYRMPKRDGSAKRPGKVWAAIGYDPKTRNSSKAPILAAERELLEPFIDNWSLEA